MDTPPLTNTLQVRSQPFLVRLDKHNKVAVLEKVKNYPLKAEDLNLAALLGALRDLEIQELCVEGLQEAIPDILEGKPGFFL